MCTQGYIKVYRGIFDEDIFKVTFSPAAAWIDLLLMAEYDDGGSLFHRGMQIQLKRGQVAKDRKELARRWSMSEKQVRMLLALWTSREQITRPYPRLPIIEIMNYDKYQDNKGQQTGLQNGQFVANKMQAQNTDISYSYAEHAEQKGPTKLQKEGQQTGQHIKEIINNNISSSKTAPAYVRVEEPAKQADEYLEDMLYMLLDKDVEWKEAMARRYFSKGAATAEQAVEALMAAITSLRHEFFLNGKKQHDDLQDLKQHINNTLRIKSTQKTYNNGSTTSTRTNSRRTGTEPSKTFSKKL